MTNQNINNNSVHQQTNIGNVENLNLTPKTRWQKYFEELNRQVENDERYATFIDDFKEYGSETAVKANGKYKQEGRNYEVLDGDIMFFRANTSNLKKK